MAVVVFVESNEDALKKTSIEAVTYASKLEQNVIALALGSIHQESELNKLANFGATRILWDNSDVYDSGDVGVFAEAVDKIVNENDASVLVLATSPFGCSLAARAAVKLDASLATNITSLPDTGDGNFSVKRSIFTGKAFEDVSLSRERKVLAIKKSAVDIEEKSGNGQVENISLTLSSSSKTNLVSREMIEGDILLPEAERVVSAGRGLKGPENWGMVEELAKEIGAATACSKPVSDMGWRPHHEHVGQTGIKVSPQLYIAIGISGAIQHLAGVNSSKNIVVINKDPDAPFFKEADYGIVGDAFEVVPKLIEAIKEAK